MKFKINKNVTEKFSNLMVYLPIIVGFNNKPSEKIANEIMGFVAAQEEGLRKKSGSLESLQSRPFVQSYLELFEQFGANTKKVIPTHLGLASRVLSGKSLPNVNPAVNIYNALSIKYVTPFGGEDLSTVYGDFELAFAKGDEQWIGINEPKAKAPKKGDLIWKDAYDVSTISLNYRQCDRTKLTPSSHDGYFVMDGFVDVNKENVKNAADELVKLITTWLGGEGHIIYLDKGNPEVEISYKSKDSTDIVFHKIDKELSHSKGVGVNVKKEEKTYEFPQGSVQRKLQMTLHKVLEEMGVDLELNKIHLERPADSEHGDWSSNVAMTLAKELGKSPREIAESIVNELRVTGYELIVEKVEIAGAGFINFYLSDDFHKQVINEIIQKGDAFGKSDYGAGKTVVIDYSSPNIAKRFSIGHLRSTIIGQALYNLYNFIGYKTVGDNHLGDWGTQFGVLIYMVESKGLDPNVLNVEDWEKIYVEFHKELDDDPTLKDKAREAFARLENGNPKARNIWQIAHKTSMAEYQKIYDLLGVSIDYAYGESFYEDKMKEGIDLAIEKGVTEQSEGALAVNFDPKYKLPSNLLLKSNKTTTYLTRDLAVMLFRKRTWNPDLQIFEVGADQKLYFKQVFALAEMLGLFKLNQLKHVAHGMIRLKEGKMSTRKGKTIKLEEVLNEAIEKAKTLGDVDEDTAKKVGVGAIKWNDLKRDPTQDIIFDWDEVLNMKGNSGPYIQYTFTRANSILNQANELEGKYDTSITLTTEEEMDVVKQLYMFPDVVSSSATSYSPNLLCTYIYSLAQKFNKFYTECSVLSAPKEEDRKARLALTMATVQVLQNGLKILGIETVERM